MSLRLGHHLTVPFQRDTTEYQWLLVVLKVKATRSEMQPSGKRYLKYVSIPYRWIVLEHYSHVCCDVGKNAKLFKVRKDRLGIPYCKTFTLRRYQIHAHISSHDRQKPNISGAMSCGVHEGVPDASLKWEVLQWPQVCESLYLWK